MGGDRPLFLLPKIRGLWPPFSFKGLNDFGYYVECHFSRYSCLSDA